MQQPNLSFNIPGICPECGSQLMFAELVLDMWCPVCRQYLADIKAEEE